MRKTKINLVCFCVMIALLMSVGLSAQEGRGRGRLVGIVVDEEGNPLEQVALTLQYNQFEYTLTAVSNAKGQWSIAGLGKGEVSVTAEKDGYLKSGLTLQVSGAQANPNQKIVMKKPGLEEAKMEGGVSDVAKDKFAQGNDYYNRRQFREALEIFREFLAENPNYYQVGLNIANCLMELEEYDVAIAEYQKVIDGKTQEPEKDVALLAQLNASIGDAYIRQKKYPQATEYFIKSMDINPADHVLAYNVAEIMMNNNNVDEAIKYYEKAITINAAWPKSYLKLGYARLNKGEVKLAKEAFRLFVEKSPASDPEVATVKEILSSI